MLHAAAAILILALNVSVDQQTKAVTIDAQGVGRMVPVQAVDVPSGAEAKLAPGGLHVMLIGLKQPLKEGQTFPLTLNFEHAGPVTVEVAIEKSASHGPATSMEHQHQSSTN